MNRYLRVEIDIEAIRKNFSFLKSWLLRESPEAAHKKSIPKIIGVVKADAYGHGAIEVSKTLQDSGIDFLATAYLEEAVQLRETGINLPILVLFEEPDPPKYIRYDLRAVIHNIKALREVERHVTSPPLCVHLKIDTGMGRLGFSPDEAINVLKRIIDNKGLRLEGIMSHFSEAELLNVESARRQLSLFSQICVKAKELLQRDIICHMANSAAVLNIKESWLSAVRPGLLLYGYLPGNLEHKELIPSMKVSTRLLTIRKVKAGTPLSYGSTFITKRESLIGIIPAGYADGLMRHLSNKGYVLVNGKRAPVVGRICMDLTIIDLTDIADNSEELEAKEVVILGRQDNEVITAKDIAHWAGTIPYEVLTTFGGLGKRIIHG